MVPYINFRSKVLNMLNLRGWADGLMKPEVVTLVQVYLSQQKCDALA